MNRKLVGLLISLLLLGASAPVDPQPAPKDLIHQMIDRTRRIDAMSYTMHKFERIKGKMIEQIAEIKYNREPYKMYARQRHPNNGLEVLYVTGENHNRVLINPNGFPWMNVSLDPNNYQMRKDQHHTVLDSGYDLVIDILEHLVDKYGTQTDRILKLLDAGPTHGKPCWTVELNNPNFRYQPYTVKEGENLISIAQKFKLGEHMILEKNPEIDDYYDVQPGQVIQVPNDYCPKMILTLDRERMIPLVMKIYDEEGLYELYEFKNIVVNPRFDAAEFTRDHPDYGF